MIGINSDINVGRAALEWNSFNIGRATLREVLTLTLGGLHVKQSQS
jgi:hypothetical protein